MESVVCNFSFHANLGAFGRAFRNDQFPCFDPIHLNLSWPISSPKALFWNFPLNFGLACNFPEIYTTTSLTLIDPHLFTFSSFAAGTFCSSPLLLLAPIKLRRPCMLDFWISKSIIFFLNSVSFKLSFLPLHLHSNPFFPYLESARGSSNGCMHTPLNLCVVIYIVGALESSCLN